MRQERGLASYAQLPRGLWLRACVILCASQEQARCGMAIARQRMMTVAEYLEWEERQELKHEYIDGEVIEMPGGTGRHSRIKVNSTLALGRSMDLSRFVIFNSDLRIKVSAARYVYPDLSVVRGQERYEFEDELTLLNPIMVVEVTSPSSQVRDRIDKLDYYQTVPSVEAYLIVEQDRLRADLFTRLDGGWNIQTFANADAVIPLAALECELPLAEIYRGVDFD